MRYTANCKCLRQTICIPCRLFDQKLLVITFPNYILISVTDLQQTIIMYCELLTTNSVICFDHPLCNLKHVIFLIIVLHNNFKSFLICFTLDIVISLTVFFFTSRYFLLKTGRYIPALTPFIVCAYHWRRH